MEKQLFSWTGWDLNDTLDVLFYDCTLKVGIGPYLSGYHIDTINVLFDAGRIDFYTTEGESPFFTAKLSLVVEQ